MKLLKTGALSAVAVLAKLIAMLGINKAIAYYAGPAGFAMVGQFQNLAQAVTGAIGTGIGTGVTKYTAQYTGDHLRQARVWKSAAALTVAASLACAVLGLLFAEPISARLLGSGSYIYLVYCFFATLLFACLNLFLLSVLNGLQLIKRYVLANVLGSVLSLLAVVCLVMLYGLPGALVALALYQALSLVTTFAVVVRQPWFMRSNFYGSVNWVDVRTLLSFSLMTIVSAICVPISHMVVRDYLITRLSSEAAGNWEAVWRLSSAYLLLITTTLSVYLLPRLSSLVGGKAIKKEILQVLVVVMPVVVAGAGLIYLLRDFLVSLLFTQHFGSMSDILGWQLLGDILKIAGWVMAYVLLSQARVLIYVVLEISFNILFVLLSWFFVSRIGLEGVTIAHFTMYILYLLATSACVASASFGRPCVKQEAFL